MSRQSRGGAAQRLGVHAERAACTALEADGWTILGQRLRTAAGEIDIAARREGVLAFIEVKARPTLAEAAYAVSPRQQRRLLLAGEILLGLHPEWCSADTRFDVILVDAAGRVRRIIDALRTESSVVTQS